MLTTLFIVFITHRGHQLVFKKSTLYPLLFNGIYFRPTNLAPFTGIISVEITDDDDCNSRSQMVTVIVKENVPENEEEINEIMAKGKWEKSGSCAL